MKKNTKEAGQAQLDQKRREFIKTSTLVGAGVASSAMLPATASAGLVDEKIESKQQQGYQLTQHVIDYYKSAAS